MHMRIQKWGNIWQQREQPLEPSTLQALAHKGQPRAHDLQPLQVHQIWNTLKKFTQKAPGLDGVGFDFFRKLPYQDLIAFFHDIEA